MQEKKQNELMNFEQSFNNSIKESAYERQEIGKEIDTQISDRFDSMKLDFAKEKQTRDMNEQRNTQDLDE